MIEIKHKITGEVLYKTENADLKYADLENANLRNADLRYANLENANLENANLRYANLRYADLKYADLENADLKYADLRNADLENADLRNADLRYANLRYANLRYANLFKTGIHSKKIIQITGLYYHIFLLDNHVKIGCEIHTKEEWKNFSDAEIKELDGEKALEFWKENKDFILLGVK